jgi:predicted ester cyclase
MESKTLRSGCRGRRLHIIVGGRWGCKHSHSASDKSEGYMMLMHESIRSRPYFHITKHALREQQESIMATEENKAIVRRFMEESFGGGEPELVDELLDPDFVRYDPYIEAGAVKGAQIVKENIVWFRNAFPDLTCTIEDQVAEGEKVVSRWTVRGTHQSEFFGVAGTGNRVQFTGIQIDRFGESGKIVEEWAEFDLLGAMRQMEAVREP